MNYILETERLSLRELTLDDTAFIIELVNTPGWLTFIGDKNIKTGEQAKSYLEKGPLKSYRENGFGLSLVEIKDSQTRVGMCGILKRDTLEHPDIGFAFFPGFMEKGYAFEIAQATVQYAIDQLKLTIIYAIVVPENVRSIKLLNKIGLTFVKRFHFAVSHQELLLYSR